jgi:hypothetical protein
MNDISQVVSKVVLSLIVVSKLNAGQLVVENKYPGNVQVVVQAANEANIESPFQVLHYVGKNETIKINFRDGRFPNLDTKFSAFGLVKIPPIKGDQSGMMRIIESNQVIVDVEKTSTVTFEENENKGIDCKVKSVN